MTDSQERRGCTEVYVTPGPQVNGSEVTELKLRKRTAYHDLGLLFAKEWGDLHRREDSLGLPLQSNNLGQREFARVIKAAKVRPITFHGLRYTSATLLLINGEPVHVVSARLGHASITTTLRTYAHVLPTHPLAGGATPQRSALRRP